MPTPLFQKGNPGKPKGCKNKKTIAFERVAKRLGEKNVHPADFLIEVMMDVSRHIDLRVDCAKELLGYLEAKQNKPLPPGPESPEQSVENARKAFETLIEASKPLEPAANTPA